MVLGLMFLVIAVAMHFALHLSGSNASIAAEASTSLVSFCTWKFAKGKKRSNTTLLIVDASVTLADAFVFSVMALGIPLFSRPEMLALICVTDTLVLRAFLVPSSARRTAVLGAKACAVTTVFTYFMYRGQHVHPNAPDAVAYTAMAAIISLATVIVTTLTSRTIFGLRQRVREASRIGQYTLLEKIGEGGMGVVYKANHAMLRRPTAIKLLAPNRAGDQDFARFEREVQLTSLLTHPNTIAIYDYGRTATGALYYAMEYLDGIDLETLVAIDGPQEPSRVAHLLRQVAGALEEAHGVGLIHRDIKPANILLCARAGLGDVAKVVDFGLVKSIDGHGDVTRSSVDQPIGTPLYMSPEAIRTPHDLGPRSDLYALGAVGYFLLAGTPPFKGNSMVEVCGHHLHSAPVPPSERMGRSLSPSLEKVILGCLEKKQENRPADARAVAAALAACADVPEWNAERAHAWWGQSRDKVLRARAESTLPIAAKDFVPREAVAIDLAARADAQMEPA
jgi:serine/threonine-protein kinase